MNVPKIKFNLASLKKIPFFGLVKYLPISVLVIMIGMLGITVKFLYSNFYETVAQVKLVSILKSQIALNQVNLPLYKSIFSAWELKKKSSLENISTIKNSFKPLPQAPKSNPSEDPSGLGSVQ